jgi:DNA invertase Pin-like site-specific DNA recombinase
MSKRRGKRYFYARVSTKKQNLARQLKVARERYADIPDECIFTDKQSGKNMDRDEYQRMKSLLEPGDEVIVLSLDRLGRKKEEVKAELAWFKAHGVMVRILNIPTTLMEIPEGQEWLIDMLNNIVVEVMGAIAEQEREMMLERQAEGIEAMPVDENGKRRSVKTGGNFGPAKIVPVNFREVYARQQAGELTLKEALSEVGIGRTRWYELARGV